MAVAQWLPLLLLLLLLTSVAHSTTSTNSDFLGCGGFIKSDIPIKFSSVLLKLYSKQGTLKYQTDCAPNNGYYLIPLYDKGDYVLQVEPPTGWKFEPSKVALHIDGTTDPCSKGKDINFFFKGFSVTGKVLSRGSSEGPAGVNVSLKAKGQNQEVLAETTSGEKGDYEFAGIFPGSYVVAASHPRWKFLVSQSTIDVAEDNGHVAKSLVVAGYDVEGSVSSEGELIQNVHFVLFSRQPIKHQLDGCLASVVDGFVDSKQRVPLCHVASDLRGNFVFPAIPPGRYTVVPFYKGENIKFDVSPGELNFTVGHSSLTFEKTFKVEGFSVGGWVRASTVGNAGIAQARVLLNGQQVAQTSSDGHFQLENMKPGMYKLQVVKDGVNFDTLNVKITPNTPRIPEIIAKAFRVCGHLQVVHLPTGMDVNAQRLIQLKNKLDNVHSVSTRTDKNGHFCIEVGRGSYEVFPTIDDSESSVGLKFKPFSHSISVEDKPLKDINFTQMFSSIVGQVNCQVTCKEVQASLKPLDAIHRELASVTMAVGDTFTFDALLPGEYNISIVKESWCWKEKSVRINIRSGEKSIVQFVHNGYKMMIVSSHDTEIVYKLNSDVTGSLNVLKGSNELCVPKEGTYEIVPNGCHLFSKDKLKHSTSNPTVLTLTATHHLLTGKVKSKMHIADLTVQVHVETDGTPTSASATALDPKAVPKSGEFFVYEFSYWSPPGLKLKFIPLASALLFYPTLLSVTVQQDCLSNFVEFEAKQGTFISGQVNPPLAEVQIVVSLDDASLPPITATTTSDGRYKAGPLHANHSYSITASKEGYLLTNVENTNNFDAFKLAEIHVSVVDAGGQPLSGVLLSLSGGSDYRYNILTQADGSIKFVGLHPGQYFLRPMLKEFSFDPASTMIDMTEGINKQLILRGKRIAFSCFGKVTSLTGDPEKAVVEVVGMHNCSAFQEEAMTEQDGQFRIRGLIPHCHYKLGMKTGPDVNQHIERSTPSSINISVKDSDVTGLHLILFRYFTQMDMSGNIVTPPEYLSTLKVSLSKDDTIDQMIHTHTLSTSSFFQFPSIPLDGRLYTVKLETTLSRTSHGYVLPQHHFKANVTYSHITLHFSPTSRPLEHEVHQSSPLALIVTLVVVVLLCSFHRLMPLFNQANDLLLSFTRRNSDINNGDSTERKKRIKLRKVQ